MPRAFGLLEAAVSCGSPTRGSELAYDALMAAGLGGLFPGSRYPMDKLAPCGSYPPRLLHLDTVMAVNRALRRNTLTALERGEYPVIIGGDHSIAMGSLAALGEFYGAENVAVVYIDGHTDINTDQTSVTGCIHGMDLAAACGICCDQLTVGKNKVNVLGENIHIIDARSIDPPEYDIVRQLGVHLYTADDVRALGLAGVLDRVLPALTGKRVHISFDVDSMDPAAFSATGYNLPGGLTLEEARAALCAVLETGLTCSFECVEYNPAMDPQRTDEKKLLDLLTTVSRLLNA